MQIAELYDFKQFRLVDGPIADPGPGEVQARVLAVGICGSDVHNFSEGGIGDSKCQYPMVLGHEPTGEIVKTGPGVTGWSAGDRVMLEPACYCYHCEYCISGHHNVCANLRFLSMPGTPGFFREFVNLPVANLVPVPVGMGLEEATIFEPLAVVVHSLKFADLKLGDTAAVYGGGPIGLLTVAALKLAGASRIWCVEPLEHRREMALRMGATAVVDPSQVDAAKQIQADTGKGGVDVAFDCATKTGTMDQCILAVRNAGRVVITGIPSEVRVALDFHEMRRKEVHLFNVRRSNRETDVAVRLMRERPDLFGPLVTHTRPIDQIQGAFEAIERYETGIGKMVLTFPQHS